MFMVTWISLFMRFLSKSFSHFFFFAYVFCCFAEVLYCPVCCKLLCNCGSEQKCFNELMIVFPRKFQSAGNSTPCLYWLKEIV